MVAYGLGWVNFFPALCVNYSPAMTAENETLDDRVSIADLVAKAKDENMDIVQLLKSNMPVVEVTV